MNKDEIIAVDLADFKRVETGLLLFLILKVLNISWVLYHAVNRVSRSTPSGDKNLNPGVI